MPATANAVELTIVAALAAADKKAEEIIALDVSERLVLTDAFLVAKDVGQNGELAVVLKDQTHCHASDRSLQRNARIHHRQRAAADRSHRRRAVRFRDFGHDADGIGEVRRSGQNRLQRAPCQLAVADFAATGGTDAAHFTDRIGREVDAARPRRGHPQQKPERRQGDERGERQGRGEGEG